MPPQNGGQHDGQQPQADAHPLGQVLQQSHQEGRQSRAQQDEAKRCNRIIGQPFGRQAGRRPQHDADATYARDGPRVKLLDTA